MSLLGRLLPAGVVAVETFDDPPVELFPEEAALVAQAVERRRREFATVRHCARLALARLGIPAAPLLPDERRAPVWPAGIVGSMTHCDGYRAAAVAHRRDVRGLGIDAEPNERLPDGVLELVAVGTEPDVLDALAADRPQVCWDRLLFSAKESVYKAWYPLTGRWLDFDDVVLTVDPCAHTFAARIRVPDPAVPAAGLTGTWAVGDGLILTAVALAVDARK